MIAEIVIVIILIVILIVLLRHWPETADAPLRQQLNIRKPLAEEESHKRASTGSGWKQWSQTVERWFTSLFADRSDQVGGEATPAPRPKKVTEEEVAEVRPTVLDPAKRGEAGAESNFEVLFAKAEAAQRKGDYEEAEKQLVKAATLEPKNPKVYSKLGIIYLEQGDNWKEAEESFRQALKYDAGNGYLHNNLGLVLYHQDKYVGAAREYEAAIKIDENIASRHVNLGLCYMSLRQFGKAESSLKKAVRLEPANTEYQDLANEATAKKKSHQAKH